MMQNVLYEMSIDVLEQRKNELLDKFSEGKATKTVTRLLFEILGVIDWRKNLEPITLA
ncbi:MAG: hypothetical protein Q7K42_03940 [Candidatus Diapherotrites archaeon]|nr:hypothetical protein [Candidatus Diapherotrites archaeon]